MRNYRRDNCAYTYNARSLSTLETVARSEHRCGIFIFVIFTDMNEDHTTERNSFPRSVHPMFDCRLCLYVLYINIFGFYSPIILPASVLDRFSERVPRIKKKTFVKRVRVVETRASGDDRSCSRLRILHVQCIVLCVCTTITKRRKKI